MATAAPASPLAAADQTAKALIPAAGTPVGYGAGQNPFAAAANNVDQQKAAMLSAVANGGSAGRAMLDQANANVASGRQAAVQAALAASATRGAGAGLGAQAPGMAASISGAVGSPGQQYGADLSAAGRNYTENNAYLQQGYNTYANEAKAAVPVIEANTQAGLQAKRMAALTGLANNYQAAVAKGQLAADSAAQSRDLKNLDLQIAEQRLANSQQSGSGAGANNIGKTLTLQTPYSYGQGPLKSGSETVKNSSAGIRTTAMYGQALQDGVGAAAAGHDPSTVESALLSAGYPPEVVDQVMSDLKGNYASSTSSSTTNSTPSGGTTTSRTTKKSAKGG